MSRPRLALSLPLILLLCLLASCAATQPGSPLLPGIDDGDGFTLAAGERVRLADAGTLTYLEPVSDSRCPSDVQCVRAGVAELAFHWQPFTGNGRRLILTTATGGGTWTFSEHRLVLQAVARGANPKATLALESAAR